MLDFKQGILQSTTLRQKDAKLAALTADCCTAGAMMTLFGAVTRLTDSHAR